MFKSIVNISVLYIQLPQYTLYGLSICSNEDPNKELRNACRDGDVGMVRNAIRKGAYVNPRRGTIFPVSK